jgi:hypothetical protein
MFYDLICLFHDYFFAYFVSIKRIALQNEKYYLH